MNKTEIILDKSKTCCVTGHRILPEFMNVSGLYELLELKMIRGYDTFLIGMAIGFDTLCFDVLSRLKDKYEFRIIACIPCLGQDKFFTDAQKKKYAKMLSNSDEIIYVSEEYYSGCMQKRNRFMVDNSSCVIGFCNKTTGGTKYTLDYAEKCGVKIENTYSK